LETNQKINKSREDNAPVALKSPVNYFLIQEMSMANRIDQVSWNQFLGKIFESIEYAEKDNFPKKKITKILKH
jgi:hypothetical protein